MPQGWLYLNNYILKNVYSQVCRLVRSVGAEKFWIKLNLNIFVRGKILWQIIISSNFQFQPLTNNCVGNLYLGANEFWLVNIWLNGQIIINHNFYSFFHFTTIRVNSEIKQI